jgi:hypothetical protein
VTATTTAVNGCGAVGKFSSKPNLFEGPSVRDGFCRWQVQCRNGAGGGSVPGLTAAQVSAFQALFGNAINNFSSKTGVGECFVED